MRKFGFLVTRLILLRPDVVASVDSNAAWHASGTEVDQRQRHPIVLFVYSCLCDVDHVSPCH